jgi:hypothetical protein
MKNRLKVVLLSICSVFLLGSFCIAADLDDRAIAAGASFATIIEDGNFQAAYWVGSPLLRLANPEQEWLDRIARSQQVLGKVLERKFKHLRAVTSPAGLPDDDYRIILFTARTEYKAEAVEVILLHQVNGFWQVCSYSIR